MEISDPTLKVARWCVADVLNSVDIDAVSREKIDKALDELSAVIDSRKSNKAGDVRKTKCTLFKDMSGPGYHDVEQHFEA